MLDTTITTSLAEVPDVGLADQRLLDQGADLRVPSLGQDLRPEDRLVSHRALRQGERPFTEPFVRSRAADRRDVEPILDGLAHRNAVVRDARPEHGQATLFDQFVIGIHDGLDRAFRETPGLADNELDGTIDEALLQAFSEHEFEREKEVVDPLLGMVLGHHPVHQDAELDGLGVRLVGQLAPLDDAPSRRT